MFQPRRLRGQKENIMHFFGFTIKQTGRVIGSTPIREQATGAAKARTQQTRLPVSVIAHCDTGKEIEVIFHPDGTSERIRK
jgi:hypothetical protein